jgi:integrase
LHTRNKGIFYAELITPEGIKLTARSTGTRDRDEALLKVSEWLKNGIPTRRGHGARPLAVLADLNAILATIRKRDFNQQDALQIVAALKSRGLIEVAATAAGKGAVVFTEFLEEFWDYTASPYIREKLAHGQSMGHKHCALALARVQKYWEPAFKGRTLASITRQDLKDFSMSLSNADKDLAASTINGIFVVGTTAITWAYREGMIAADPTVGLVRFSGKAEKRGILTPDEAAAVFSVQWKDRRAYVANLLACTTGLRAGEILALKREDIGERILDIKHSWSVMDGIKTPKNGEERRTPLLPGVRKRLLELADESPYGKDGFIFFSAQADRPADSNIFLEGLREACEAAGIDAEERGIVFHSWRHYYAARMTDRMSADQISRITGHKTKAVFEHYADHITDQNLDEVGAVAAETFENILQFQKGA